MINDAAVRSKIPHASVAHDNRVRNSNERWQKLVSLKDPKLIWRAIDWSGSFDIPTDSVDTPSDKAFADHFKQLLNPEVGQDNIIIPQTNVYIPILDDPITPNEVLSEMHKLNPGKAAGPDGLGPGLLRFLPEAWVVLMSLFFNVIFYGMYPVCWLYAKLFVIFKKRLRSNPGNYRGISVMCAFAKLYDKILNSRLIAWYTPNVEQAGAQRGRGCIEQISTLRLLIDIARSKKRTMYVVFIDYVKAYDKVNRSLLLDMLVSKGCDNAFLQAIGKSMQKSLSVLGCETIIATMGVRQGGTSSCSLFTLVIDHTIDKIRQLANNGWLSALHILLLMDDTVLLATTRRRMQEKLVVLCRASREIGMTIHPVKSRYLAINVDDTSPFVVDDVTISHTDSYTYLGTPIMNAGINKQVEVHLQQKLSHLFKFSSFCRKNADAPYAVKKMVWHSCMQSAILYGCETWLTPSLSCLSRPFLRTVKDMLGVRPQTYTSAIIVETGICEPKALIHARQKRFLSKLRASSHYQGSPVQQAICMAVEARCPMGRHICKYLDALQQPPDLDNIKYHKNLILNNPSSKPATYMAINPTLSVHPMYCAMDACERERISASRLRLGSHHLKIETGRWSRIPRDNRLCPCGAVQDESHAMLSCPFTQNVRDTYATRWTMNPSQPSCPESRHM